MQHHTLATIEDLDKHTAPPQEPLDGVVRIYADKLLQQTGEEPFPTAKIIDFNLSSFPSSPEDFPSAEDFAAQLAQIESAIGPIAGRLEAAAGQYAAFLARFDAQAVDGKLDKAKCVILATERILEVNCGGGVEDEEAPRSIDPVIFALPYSLYPFAS